MSKQFKLKTTQGFTLVELSIVIVIIGFLVAGIAAGANMVKQAQIRSVITDLQSYQTAVNNFKAKYNKLPGDIDTATSFWPSDGQCLETVAGNEDVCNGDNNGGIDGKKVVSGDETRAALKHLALANMISAGIPVVPTTIAPMVAGKNTPASKISGAGYYLVGGIFPIPGYGLINVVAFGKNNTVDTNNLLNYGALTPEDAFSIDQKIDDGTISGTNFLGSITGNLWVFDGGDVQAANDCSDLVANTYTIATTYTACQMFFIVTRD